MQQVEPELLGAAPSFRRLLALLEPAARSGAPVLLMGESGSGKELLAREVHRRGPRARGPLVAVNCAAIPDALLEAELFGWRRGAFSGAERDHTGLLVQADRGTLFLDEVGDMSPRMQAKLLRALEGDPVRPLGGGRPRPVELRVVAATHRDLPALVRAGEFRQDLWWRLAVIPLRVPPLRERGDDVLLLAERFLRELPGGPRRLTDGARARLRAHPWPGNVRELRNAVRRAASLGGPVLEARDFAFLGAGSGCAGPAEPEPGRAVSLRELERREVERALVEAGGHVRRAARLLGVHPATLYRKLKRWAG